MIYTSVIAILIILFSSLLLALLPALALMLVVGGLHAEVGWPHFTISYWLAYGIIFVLNILRSKVTRD